MRLQDKILYCRKKTGLSQEALAEKLGVSRQAVSKRETGEAVPEIAKLLLLAEAFGVTTDWLLSEDDPEPESSAQTQTSASGFEHIPGVIGRLVRRWGWLAGVYLAVVGALFGGMGALMRTIRNNMFSSMGFDQIPGGVPGASSDPMLIMTNAVMIVGVVLLVGGVILAVWLKKRGAAQK